jgi:hypothetical protein
MCSHAVVCEFNLRWSFSLLFFCPQIELSFDIYVMQFDVQISIIFFFPLASIIVFQFEGLDNV